ncbi:MAG: hypothetical protein ACFFF4_03695 [Candidatus Thorarchaeota archaeon]
MELVTEIILISVVLLLAALLRIIPHIRFPFPATPDTFFLLNKLKNIDYREAEIRYPRFFTQLTLVAVSKEKLGDGRRLNEIAIMMDLFTATIIFVFIRSYIGSEIAILTTLFFVTTPMVTKQGTTYAVRPFGLFLVSTSLLILLLPFPWNWLAAIPMAFILLSHRLSTQTTFIISLGLFVIDYQIPVIFAVGFILAVILSKGDYLEVLKAHLNSIWHYWKHGHYPNRRMLGMITMPTSFGYLAYIVLKLIQMASSDPVSVLSYRLPTLPTIDSYTETLMMIWGLICLGLLIFWVAGESYKHLPLAAVPFGMMTSLLTNTDILFTIVSYAILTTNIIGCLYFQISFEHVNEDFIEIVKTKKGLSRETLVLTPPNYDRALEFFTDYQSIIVYFDVWTREEFEDRALSRNPTLAVVKSGQVDWFVDWKRETEIGDWVLLSKA